MRAVALADIALWRARTSGRWGRPGDRAARLRITMTSRWPEHPNFFSPAGDVKNTVSVCQLPKRQ
jgi:hypothetical protein